MATVEAAIQALNRREHRLFKERVTLTHMRDMDILSRYRLDRVSILELTDLVRGDMERVTNRSCSIPVLTQVLIGLRYFAKGDFLSEVADLHGVSRASACNIIESFAESINKRLNNINFPDGTDLSGIKKGFFQKCKLPNTVGAVDGTLIPIMTPSENEEIFVCRKNYHALNIQAVVEHQARFIDVVAKWPGSTHDASILENSDLKRHLETNQLGHLLGDSGYGLKKFVLTPKLNPTTDSELAYNHAHSCGRMVVERAFGMLKSRFRCLHKTGGILYMKPGKCCKVIVACTRLHNFCMSRNVPLPEAEEREENEENEEDRLAGNPDINAINYRQHFINLFD